jgi:phospholipase C
LGLTRPTGRIRRREWGDRLPHIGHIVILMMENHSYDNYFGLLTGRGEGRSMLMESRRRPIQQLMVMVTPQTPAATRHPPLTSLQLALRAGWTMAVLYVAAD